MPAPSNIVLTPTSGVAPFSVSISGTNLFERPGYVACELFTASMVGSNYTLTRTTDISTNTITMPNSADAPPEGQAVYFYEGTGNMTINSVALNNLAYYGVPSPVYYVKRVTTKSFNLVTFGGSTPLAIGGSTWTTCTMRYSKTNDAGFGVGSYDCLPNGWLGSMPTRMDGQIGKCMVAAVASTYMKSYYVSSPGAPDIAASGSNCLFPCSIANKVFWSTRIFVTSGSTSTTVPIGYFYKSNSSGGTVSGPGTTTASSNIDYMALYITSTGRISFTLNGKHTDGSNPAKKWVYTTATATVNYGAWNHILCQWNGVALDTPEIWVNGVKFGCTVLVNNLLGGFTWVTSDDYASGAGKTAYAQCNLGNASVYTGGTPDGVSANTNLYLPIGTKICDVYIGNQYLTDSQVLMYANLPKVELIKV